ncbi:hypothetical protein BGZ99_005405 [Dissophora globulifera]|uniref:F-box domain-containing protein n=1 Tax=Dissophora globulifera TaxID=979702 RepID=A0A9P6RSK7_9FUNG|nr:hypothetical protein BGZ99_005405 [Dissophora globulifera]
MSILHHLRALSFGHKRDASFNISMRLSIVAIEIPEILEEVLSYLSDSDLRYRTRGVNRLWQSISDRLIQGEAHWKDTHSVQEQHRQLALLSSEQTKTFYCYCQDESAHLTLPAGIEQDAEQAWMRLMQTIVGIVEAKRSKTINSRHGVQTGLPWRTLVFSGRTVFNEKWDPLFRESQMFLNLGVLRLEHLTPGAVELDSIFSGLPKLKELVVESSESQPYTYRQNTTITWRERAELPVLGLRSLRLGYLTVSQSMLETILNAMPHLRSLNLVSLIANCKDAEATIDRPSFVEHISQVCPDLLQFHLSFIGSRMTISDVQQLQLAFPKLSNTTFSTSDIVPGFLDLFVDRLTTLEIKGFLGGLSDFTLGDYLHAYLCQAPLLLHLKTYGVKLFHENFVLQLNYWTLATTMPFSAWTASRDNNEDMFDQPVWACRGLRTLYVLADSRAHTRVAESRAISRIVFGYISRVCPRLEDVAIERRYLNTDFAGGIALLSRCKRLRRLRLYTNLVPTPMETDLEWLALGMPDTTSVATTALASTSDSASASTVTSTTAKKVSLKRVSLLSVVFNSHVRPPMSSKRVQEVSNSARESRGSRVLAKIKELEIAASQVPSVLSTTLTHATSLPPPPTPAPPSIYEQTLVKPLQGSEAELSGVHVGGNTIPSSTFFGGDDRVDQETEDLDPNEMTTLHDIRHLLKQLKILVRLSEDTARDDSRACCWPQLEVFEINQKTSRTQATPAAQDLIQRLRPDLADKRSTIYE